MTKPRPAITAESAPFWAACAEGRLLFQRCNECGRAQPYPRAVCVACGSPRLAWQDAARHGTVATFTVVHRAPSPAFKADVPYTLALVDLDEGVRMMLGLRAPADQVAIGQRVMVDFAEQDGGWWLPQAVPAP